ncbi:MAG: hypothetical protein NPINA01_11600 [Nitrospinaceae bacterium]|nr:MAG: hypothetical protein NPINA01_11600 [Nitrospinaceae bacterium]
MKISRDKINHISSLIVRDFKKRDEIDYKVDLNDVRLEITRVITDMLMLDDKADELARKTITSYSKTLREGSPEWEVMYHKHYEQELNKLGL